MFISNVFVALAVVAATQAAPLNKRIAQTIADSTAKWEQACLAAGGADKCNPQSQASFDTLLAAAGPCDQQNQGDAMIDLAKQLNNDPDMIKFTQIFVQQPRNSPDALSVPYCQEASKNAELNGLFQCQFQGSNPTLFVGNVEAGGNGTIPFGQSAVLSPPGSCPANPAGPIADGTQLTDITDDPGVGTSNSSTSSPPVARQLSSISESEPISSEAAEPPQTISFAPTPFSSAGTPTETISFADPDPASSFSFAAPPQPTASFGAGDNDDSSFKRRDGGSDSSVNAGSDENGTSSGIDENSFGPVGGDSGAPGPVGGDSGEPAPVGSDSGAPSSGSDSGSPGVVGSDSGAPAQIGGDSSKRIRRASFTLQNGLDAQKLNAQFSTLSAASPCTEGSSACANGQFAQCSGGKLALSQCASGTQCFALPLVNEAGTSITCDTQADAQERIAATGATGGITGSN